ncbi:MAG: hypothetical protein QHJ73_13145, partial [Armatimonadota bacterium]|nr:hypothetical protein [Armatimonadota bacterium]
METPGVSVLPEKEDAAEGSRMVTGRAIAAAVLLTVLSGFWIRESEIVALGVYITESVPTIPGVAALLLVLLGNVLLQRTQWKRFAFSRGELLFVFLFVCVATAMFSCGIGRFFLALITAPFYYAQTGNRLADAQKYLPDWAVVRDPAAIKGLYESLHGSPIPWAVWLKPLAAWGGFFLAFWLAMLCMVLLMHRPWVEKEKLSFPLVQLPLELTDLKPRAGGMPPFFRNPVMWGGFLLSFAFNATNIIHALVPAFPRIANVTSFVPFTAPPMNAVGTVTMYHRPELIGFGYLVSTEISFSIWLTFILEKAVAVVMSSVGYREAGVPFTQEQSMGAYIALALTLLYLGRNHLAAIARAAFFAGDPEMRRYRAAFWGFLVSAAALLFFCRMLGIQWWVAAVYLGVVLATSLVYARARAETGIPLIWLFPYGMPKT